MNRRTHQGNEMILTIRNMVCDCCIKVIRDELENIDTLNIKSIRLGEIRLIRPVQKPALEMLEKRLSAIGFEVVTDKDKILVEQVKQAIIHLVHHTTFNAMVRNSDYLVERFELSYPYLSNLFSKAEGLTLEKYIILQKIEKVKELIQYNDLSISEIAYMMGYSSVQYLYTQFKSVTKIPVTDFKKDPAKYRKSVDNLK